MSDLEIEREIPVLAVWKNNSILKNIFLININNNQEIDHNQAEICPDFDESLLVGRHPDCDIRLEHPSISRFHLRIHSFSSSKRLFLTDLSSVHGTWVSGRRIEPNIRTIVNEGDHLRIGGSGRVYKLHWIPLSQAYDVSKPFVPPLDLPGIQEDEDEIVKKEISVELIDEEVHNVVDISNGLESRELCGGHQMVSEESQEPLSVKDEATESANVNFEGLDSLCLDGISQEVELKEMLVEPSICNDDLEVEDVQSVNSILDGLVPFIMGDISQELGQKEMFFAPPILNKEFESEDVHSVDSILEGLVPLIMGENWEWVGLEQNYLPCPTEEDQALQSKVDETSLVREGLDPLFLDANSDLLAPLMSKEVEFPAAENTVNIAAEERREFASEILGEYVLDHALPSKDDRIGPVQEGSDILILDVNSELPSKDDEISSVLEGLDTLFFGANSELLAPLMPKEMDFPIAESVDNITAEERQNSVPEILGEHVLDNAWSFWCGSHVTPSSPPSVEDKNPDHKLEVEVLVKKQCLVSSTSDLTSSAKEHQESELWSFWSGKMGVESDCSALSGAEQYTESENKSFSNAYLSSPPSPLILSEQKPAHGFLRENLGSIGFSDAESFSESENESCGECYQSPKPLTSLKGRFGSPLIWLSTDENKMKMEAKSDQQDSVSRSLFHEENSQEDEIFTPDKENITPIIWSRAKENKLTIDQKSDKNGSISRILFHGKNNWDEEEVFTPDKENFTPTTHKSMRKLTVLKDISNISSGKSSLLKMSCCPNNCYEGTISPLPEKGKYSTGTQLKQKTARRGSANKVQSVRLKERIEDRIPFQSLLANSPQKSITESNIADNEMNIGIYVDRLNVFTSKGKGVRKEYQQWNMVVDTSTLLNKESRKALQLLEGLKGTQLIIPRIVLMELASLKQQGSFFRRNIEVLSALEWIQDCILRTGWWVHVQNPAEDDGSCASFSDFESQMEVLSPAVEDNVLAFALSLRNTNHGQPVLLSNHVTMMIKAMALGMICETGEQFRGSLVNPFSERFRWADSSPRGQTWSCADDFVLKKRFYPSSLMMTPKSMENVKGLNLVLLHNSRYQESIKTTWSCS